MIFVLAKYFFVFENNELPWFSFSADKSSGLNSIIFIRKDNNLSIVKPGTKELIIRSFFEVDNFESLEQNLYRCCANVLLTKGVLHLHSSFVLYKDKALVFTGPSGIGKTTQAELWRDFQGALIVNGDACLLRRMEDGWHAFGTPVHGSSPYCENREAPLSALVVLKQGRENRLERLDAFSALSECLPEFYRPRMDHETEDTFWKAADSLFREIPVYKLTCRPDREATELVKETIFGA